MFGKTDELMGILEGAKTKRDELHRTANIAFNEAAMDILQDLHQDSKNLQEFLEVAGIELLPAIKNIQAEQSRAKEAQDRKEIEKDFQNQLKWIRSGTSVEVELPEKIVKDNLDRRHPGTCKWIFEEEDFQSWRGQESNHLLWISGEAGFGKSILMSSIIDSLQREPDAAAKDKPLFIYFFCKTGNDATQRGNRIMLHLLLQLLSKGNVDDAASKSNKATQEDKANQLRKEKCIEIVKEARARTKDATTSQAIDSTSFQLKSGMQPLLCDLAKALERRVYIIVDALDECIDWSDGFLDALQGIADFDADIRVLISSRPEDEIRDVLYVYPNIEVTKASTEKDVQSYVFESLKKIKRFKPEQRLAARDAIAAKSDGMFRCKISKRSLIIA
jgi:ABC-type dipeptide/oligopeptide/nickel transport system ATPase component